MSQVSDGADDRRADVGEQVAALCAKLGFPDKSVVAEIRVSPTEATVLYYPLDENGDKHVEADGYPAARWRRIRVMT